MATRLAVTAGTGGPAAGTPAHAPLHASTSASSVGGCVEQLPLRAPPPPGLRLLVANLGRGGTIGGSLLGLRQGGLAIGVASLCVLVESFGRAGTIGGSLLGLRQRRLTIGVASLRRAGTSGGSLLRVRQGRLAIRVASLCVRARRLGLRLQCVGARGLARGGGLTNVSDGCSRLGPLIQEHGTSLRILLLD